MHQQREEDEERDSYDDIFTPNSPMDSSRLVSPTSRGGQLGAARPPSPFALPSADGGEKNQSSSGSGDGQLVIVGNDDWQHVVSIGRDGCVFLENLAYGSRPTTQVPSSVLALSNSNTLAAVHQLPPNRQEDDWGLTLLRRDATSESALGVFATSRWGAADGEEASTSNLKQANEKQQSRDGHEDGGEELNSLGRWGRQDEYCRRVQETNIQLTAMDTLIEPHQKYLKHFALTWATKESHPHMTSSELCQHNSTLCSAVGCEEQCRMWLILASLLETKNEPGSLFLFIGPTAIESLLQARIDCGDVQSAVYVCLLLGVFQMAEPPFPIQQVREWFLSYIEMLRSRAMFVEATEIVKLSGDSGGDVGSMSRMGTDIFTSCPTCLKPLANEGESGKSMSMGRGGGSSGGGGGSVEQERILRSCGSCKNKLALCGLCHDPIRKQMTFCIGCSHGFHLEHAAEWFKDNAMCPTGCGHICRGERGSFIPREVAQ
jgi:hypothetical protein